MDEMIKNIDPNIINRAVSIWTGYESEMCPTWNAADLSREFSHEEIKKLIPILESLSHSFYESIAYLETSDLSEMGVMAANDFREKYPFLPDEVGRAFAWCYTFDYK